jgi:hypothetical protein
VKLIAALANILIIAALCVGLLACKHAYIVDNTAPELYGVGPVEPLSPDLAQIGLWVLDFDADPVDVTLEWLDASGKATPVVDAPGGHGQLGLSSSTTPPGKPHALLWNTKGIDPKAQIRLRMTPDDRAAGKGQERTSPTFTLEQGLPATKLI